MRKRKTWAAAMAAALLGAGGTAVPATAAESPQGSYLNSCDQTKAALPAVVEGAPTSFGPGAPTGLYLWHEKAGWRLRVSHDQTVAGTAGTREVIEVAGRVTASKPIRHARAVLLEKGGRDFVAVRNPAKRVMDFRFRNGGLVDGANFTAGCAGRLVIDVRAVRRSASGVSSTALAVYLGAGATPLAGAAGVVADGGVTDRTRLTILRSPVPTAPTLQGAFRNSCKVSKAQLPATALGAPAGFGPGAPTGAYVWNDASGWHVRVSHDQRTADGKRAVIEVGGRVATSRGIQHLTAYRLEPATPGEWLALRKPGRQVLTFRFVNGGFVDGLDFRAGCAGRVQVDLWAIQREGGNVTRVPLPVFLGAAATPAAQAGVPLVTTPNATRLALLRSPV